MNAVESARRAKGGVVVLPAGRTFLSRPLHLVNLSSVVLCVEGTLRAVALERWPPPPCPSLSAPCAVSRLAGGKLSPEALRVQEMAFLRIDNGRNVTVGGLGTIDGAGSKWCASPPAVSLTTGRPKVSSHGGGVIILERLSHTPGVNEHTGGAFARPRRRCLRPCCSCSSTARSASWILWR